MTSSAKNTVPLSVEIYKQGKRLLGYLTHVLLIFCPPHTFGLLFFPLFTEYIDVFRIRIFPERKVSHALPYWHADL